MSFGAFCWLAVRQTLRVERNGRSSLHPATNKVLPVSALAVLHYQQQATTAFNTRHTHDISSQVVEDQDKVNPAFTMPGRYIAWHPLHPDGGLHSMQTLLRTAVTSPVVSLPSSKPRLKRR
ncbi:hypothetical protein ABBQ38_003840 [Trebouxia sp. C0009 RCD-2024]